MHPLRNELKIPSCESGVPVRFRSSAPTISTTCAELESISPRANFALANSRQTRSRLIGFGLVFPARARLARNVGLALGVTWLVDRPHQQGDRRSGDVLRNARAAMALRYSANGAHSRALCDHREERSAHARHDLTGAAHSEAPSPRQAGVLVAHKSNRHVAVVLDALRVSKAVAVDGLIGSGGTANKEKRRKGQVLHGRERVPHRYLRDKRFLTTCPVDLNVCLVLSETPPENRGGVR